MNIWDIIQNPILIGVFSGLSTYIYMYHQIKKENKKRAKLGKKKKEINLLIPFAILVISWFLSYAYFSNNTKKSLSNPDLLSQSDFISQNIINKKFTDTELGTNIKLISTGHVNIPSNLGKIPETLFSVTR